MWPVGMHINYFKKKLETILNHRNTRINTNRLYCFTLPKQVLHFLLPLLTLIYHVHNVGDWESYFFQLG